MRRAFQHGPPGRRGSTALEAVLFLPVLFVLLFGMVEIARITYTYYTLEKMMYTLARFLGTQQGVNFCDDADPAVVAAKNYVITGTIEGETDPLLPNLTADMIRVRIERFNRDSQELGECDCSITGCDASQGGLSPDFIVVSIPDGYPVRPVIPGLLSEDIPLKPQIRVPFGGT